MADSRKQRAMRRSSARAAGRTRSQLMTPGRIVEQGVGWGNVARGVARIAGNVAKSKPKTPAKTAAKSPGTTKGVSKVTGGVLKNGKPAKYGPAKKKLTPQQKAAQTRAMNKWRAEQAKKAAEGPKRRTPNTKAAAEGPKKGMSGKKKAAYIGGGAGVVGLGVGGVVTGSRKKTPATKQNRFRK